MARRTPEIANQGNYGIDEPTVIRKLIEKLDIDERDRILDIGCGRGFVLNSLAKQRSWIFSTLGNMHAYWPIPECRMCGYPHCTFKCSRLSGSLPASNHK